MVNDWMKLSAMGAAFTYFGGYQLPGWASPIASGLVIVGIDVLLATGKVDDPLPDPPRVHLVQVDANSDDPLIC